MGEYLLAFLLFPVLTRILVATLARQEMLWEQMHFTCG